MGSKEIAKVEKKEIAKVETKQDQLQNIAKGLLKDPNIKGSLNALLKDPNEVNYAALFMVIPKGKKDLFYALYSASVAREIDLYKQDQVSDCCGEKIPYNSSCDLHTTCTIARINGSAMCGSVINICKMLPQKRLGGTVNHNRRLGELIKMLIAFNK